MSTDERRNGTRMHIRVPLRFRTVSHPVSADQSAESENFSQRGLYFSTDFPMKVGTLIEIFLRMPKELFGKMASDVMCIARVVRVDAFPSAENKVGVALQIERYEAVIAKERWAN